MRNRNLSNAKREKNDEFYTQWRDIEVEMNAYLEYNPDVFRGKTVLLPCDDPTWSNFTKYFALRFDHLGLKKLISTSYAPNSNKNGRFYTPQQTLFEGVEYDKETDFERGKIFILESDEKTKDGIINIEDIQWEYLKGDGDFRSEEVSKLRDEADFVITNPPFSLFREFIDWVLKGKGCQFSVIGNMNAITYKEIFPLIKDNKMWLGATSFNSGMFFRVPEDFVYSESYKFKKEENGVKVSRVPGVCWFSSTEHGKRHKPLSLMTKADNERFNTKVTNSSYSYKKYDNYNAIEVPNTSAIPSDYTEVMGVPITFLDKYCPEQFEILGGTANGQVPKELKEEGFKSYNNPLLGEKKFYQRILIKHKNPA